MQPRFFVAAAALSVAAIALAGCGVGPLVVGAAPPAGASPTVTAVGYALVTAPAPVGAVGLHINILINGTGARATFETLTEAVQAVEAALRSAGAPAAGIGVAGAPGLTAQVGPAAVEATQTVVARLATMAAAFQVLARLRTDSLAGYDGYYLAPLGVPAPSPAAQASADRHALAEARSRAASLALAEGHRLGALVGSRSDLLAASPCAPVSGCASASGDLVPAPGADQIVIAVRATYATR